MPKIKKVKSARGGARPGSGRPKKRGATICISARITPEADIKLRAQMHDDENGYGDFLERLSRS